MIPAMVSMVQTVKEALVEFLVPPLKQVFGPLDHWLDSAPSWVGQACAISLFLIGAGMAIYGLLLRMKAK